MAQGRAFISQTKLKLWSALWNQSNTTVIRALFKSTCVRREVDQGTLWALIISSTQIPNSIPALLLRKPWNGSEKSIRRIRTIPSSPSLAPLITTLIGYYGDSRRDSVSFCHRGLDAYSAGDWTWSLQTRKRETLRLYSARYWYCLKRFKPRAPGKSGEKDHFNIVPFLSDGTVLNLVN